MSMWTAHHIRYVYSAQHVQYVSLGIGIATFMPIHTSNITFKKMIADEAIYIVPSTHIHYRRSGIFRGKKISCENY